MKISSQSFQKALLISSLSLFLASCQNFLSKNSDSSNKILAKYNGGEVTLSEAKTELSKLVAKNNKLQGVVFEEMSLDQQEVIIKEVIIKEVAYNEAKKRDLNDDDDYQNALRIFETELLTQKLFIDFAKEAGQEENLRKYYDDLVEEISGKTESKIRYMSLASKKDADYVVRRLKKFPKSFSYYAKKKSLDKETAKNGGDLGYVLIDKLPKPISDIAKSLKKGQFSKPISLGDKWLLIQLVDEREAVIQSFEDVKDSLAKDLSQKLIKDFTQDSLDEAEISILID